jgi:hypothetical protein
VGVGVNSAQWDTEWAAERATVTMRFLQQHYPECAAAPELHAYQQAAHEADVAGDREAYLEALRAYARTGRAVAMRIRRKTA